jgi:hypothetical protein
VAGEYVGIGKIENNVQLQLIEEVWHCQNAISALGTLQRARRADLGKRLEYFLQKQPLFKSSPGVNQLIKMAPLILKDTVSIVFWRLSYASLLSELHRPVGTIFADDRSAAGEIAICHLSQCH